MCEPTCVESFEQQVKNLEKENSMWFEAHKHNALPTLLVLYIKEAQSGRLKNHYACILDDSLECLISVLPQVAHHLTNAIKRVRQVPQYRLRLVLSLIVYWLIQTHTGKKNGLPEKTEMLEIIDSIMNNSVLSFCHSRNG